MLSSDMKLKATSIFVALMLTILPLPEAVVAFRPHWLLLVIVFWAAFVPEGLMLTTIWLLGIALDLLSGSTLGQNAIALMTCGFLVIINQQALRFFSLLKQSLIVAALVVLYLAMMRWLFGHKPLIDDWTYWGSCITSAILWPWIFVLLRELRRNSLIPEKR